MNRARTRGTPDRHPRVEFDVDVGRHEAPGARSPNLSPRTKISVGLGDLAMGLLWNIVAAFLLFFYTDVAMLPIAAVGTLFLLSRILDAAFDTVVGLLVDRTHSRWGRARPYFLFGTIPAALLFVLTFTTPAWSVTGRLTWAAVTFVSFGLLYSLVNIPYNALIPLITERTPERLQLSGLRSAGTALSVILATVATLPAVNYFGGKDQRTGFLIVSALAATVFCLLVLNLFYSCRETVPHTDQRPTEGIKSAILAMLHNRAWVVVFTFASLNFVRFGAVLSVTAYFAINVLHKPWMISVMLPAVSGTLLLGAAIAPPYLRILGIRRGVSSALVVSLIATALLPLAESWPVAFLTLYMFAQTVLSLTMTAIFAMAAETVDYHETLFGIRDEGLLSAGVSFATKIGTAIGSSMIAFGLAYAKYDPKAVSAGAASMVHALYYGPAIIAMALQFICIQFYPRITRGAELHVSDRHRLT